MAYMKSAIDNAELLSLTKNEDASTSLFVKIFVGEDNSWLKGHFPNYPILPGVAELDMVFVLAKKYLNLEIKDKALNFPNIKFTKPIIPPTDIFIKLVLSGNKDSLAFSIRSSLEDNPEVVSYCESKVKLTSESN